jgi:hypothetical protein
MHRKYHFHYGQAGLCFKFLTCIWELCCYGIGQDADYPDLKFFCVCVCVYARIFPHSLQTNNVIVP